MKKFLSLVLALVMTMSLVTISAGAKDFTDADTINYDEAVAVISAVKVVDGYPDGSFKPTTNLNRGQAAKIICNLKLGPTTAANLKADAAPFKDVAVDNVFAGYIAFCAKEGIVGGYADGTFKPTAPLTGYAFMKMLLGALGYDAEIEGYNAPNWSINVGKQALGIGLNVGLKTEFDGQKYVTREEACLYAFNTLKATMVDYDTKTTVNVGDASVTIAGSTAKPVSAANSNVQTGIAHDGNIKADGFVQFAEQYFTKLTRKDDSDKFMRPANTWVYDKTDIGTYADYTKLVETYKKGVTGKEVYDLLKAATIRDSILECYVDGADNNNIKKTDLVRSNNKDLKGTGTGVLTEVYLDKDAEIDVITIVSVNTYLAKATADYSEKKEYAPLSVYETSATANAYSVDSEDVPSVKDVQKDAFYLVNISKKDVANGEVVYVQAAETLTDSTVTKFSASKDGDQQGTSKVTKLTTGGQEYKANEKAFYDKGVLDLYDKSKLSDITYNVYLDTYGNFIGVDIFQGTKKYVFITGYDLGTSNLSVKTADAAAIFLDGTMESIKVNVTDTDKNITAARTAGGDNSAYFTKWSNTPAGNYALNEWYTYTTDKNGVYTLTPCVRMTHSKYPAPAPGAATPTIKTNNLIVQDTEGNDTRVYGEDETVFLVAELGDVTPVGGTRKAITKVNGVYTGVQNVELEIDVADANAITMGQVYTVYDSDHFVIGAVVLGDAKGSAANYAYVLSKAKSEEKIDDTYYWEFEAIVGGEVKTLTAKSKYKNTIDQITTEMTSGDRLVELRFDGDYVTDIKDIKNTKIYTNNTVAVVDQNFYDISSPAANELNLQGRTLYVMQNYTDYGLALAKDAKAVVIQTENSKTGVKTEFTDVSSAIARLADADTTTKGLQYSGRIVAALNSNGVAEWVLFISNTPLTTGAANAYTVSATIVGAAGSADVIFADGTNITTSVAKGEALYFGVAPTAGNKVTDVKVNNISVYPVDEYNGMDIYYISKVTANTTISVTTAPIPADTMSISVEYVTADGAVIETTRATDMAADEGENSIAVTAVVPTGYKIVGTRTQYVPFVANTSKTVTFTVAPKTTTATVETSAQLDEAIADGATTIYLTDGTYTLTEEISNDLTIIGNGDVTIEGAANPTNYDGAGIAIENGTANLVIKGVTFDGCTMGGIYYKGTGSITIEDCTFKNITGAAAIYLQPNSGIAGGTIKNCTFTNCAANIAVTAGSLNGNLTITGCDFGATGEVDVVASMAAKVQGNAPLNIIAGA